MKEVGFKVLSYLLLLIGVLLGIVMFGWYAANSAWACAVACWVGGMCSLGTFLKLQLEEGY